MEGRTVPNVVFKTRVRDESVPGPNPYRWQDLHTDELFRGKRAVVFSLPGAFTPTCSNRQCPAYDLVYDELRRHGADEVYCISVNDAFVMHQWAQTLGIKNIKLIPDGNGQFTRRMGMLVNKEHLGFGYRSWRYAMVVNDGVVEKWFEEPGINDVGADDDPYGETDPERVLAYLTETEATHGQSLRRAS
jgi:peroxiredoxin